MPLLTKRVPGAERTATFWPDGTVTLDGPDDDDEREEAD